MDFEIERQIQAELDSGEKIVWRGQPIPRLFTKKDLGQFLFMIPWTGFAIFWMFAAAGYFPGTANKHPQGGYFFLFGVPFLLIGLGSLTQPIWNYRKTFRTHYVITNRRAFIVVFGKQKQVISFLPSQLQALERRENADGSGDIILQSIPQIGSKGRQYLKENGFMNVPDVKKVEILVRDLAMKDPQQNQLT